MAKAQRRHVSQETDEQSLEEALFLKVLFYRTSAGNEPAREWLKSLGREDRRAIGEDVKTIQFGWPLGMPLVRKLGTDLWEVRSPIKDGIARILFTIVSNKMVLLHGFIKKSQKTPASDLETARRRLASLVIEVDE